MIGTELFRITPLVAVVYCRPEYAKTLCSPVPQKPSQTIFFQSRRITSRWARIAGHANGSINASATIQRMYVRANGVTWPAMARPITQLSDQKNAVRERRR
jgi:hypothetical protein